MQPTPSPAEHQLLADISRYEQRVLELNSGHDSACEKALIRSYEEALQFHRARLAALRAA